MVDTPRTQAELLALFPDNTTQDISPQDARDLIVSVGQGTLGMPDVSESFSMYVVNQSFPVAHNSAFYPSCDVNVYTGYDPDPDVSVVYIHDPLGLATSLSDPADSGYDGNAGGYYLTGVPEGAWASRIMVRFAPGTFTDLDPLLIRGPRTYPDYPYPDNYLEDTAGGPWTAPIYAYNGHSNFIWAMGQDVGGGSRQFYSPAFINMAYPSDLGGWNADIGSVGQLSGESQTVTALEMSFWRVR